LRPVLEPRRRSRGVCRAAAVIAVVFGGLCLATPSAGQGLTYEFTPDGAWNWLADPRAFYVDETIIAGWVSRDGDVQCGSFALWDGSTYITDLAYEFEQDDHTYPAFLETSDGRYTAFFSKHANNGTYVKYRTTYEPGDITSWTMMNQIPTNLPGTLGATYPNPWLVPGKTDQIFVFWRAANFQQAYSIGTYDPTTFTWTWTPAETLILNLGDRPYVKYDSFSSCRIGFAFTDGHPDHTLNNIYYASIGRDTLAELAYFRADGSKIKDLDDGPLEPWEPEVVFDRTADPDVTGDNSWIWDVSFDREGRPVIAFATFPTRTHHQYHWARFDGNEWDDQILLYDAGGSMADTSIGNPEYFYSGGITLDHREPTTVYLSHDNAHGGWDVEQWKMDDGGAWSFLPITSGATVDNVRPIVPRDVPQGSDIVLWMSGRYDYWENYASLYHFETAVNIWVDSSATSIEDGDLAAAAERTLTQNYPNPFRGATRIRYAARAGEPADLTVYDVAGRKVKELASGTSARSGWVEVEWNGRNESGKAVASGVYFCVLEAGDTRETRRMLLLR
jgi:hypothetical protein